MEAAAKGNREISKHLGMAMQDLSALRVGAVAAVIVSAVGFVGAGFVVVGAGAGLVPAVLVVLVVVCCCFPDTKLFGRCCVVVVVLVVH